MNVATSALADVQNQQDMRGVAIDRVGVSDLRYPITVMDRDRGQQHTVAGISLSVSLPHHFKGTHMSRFLEVLKDHHANVTIHSVGELLDDLRQRLHADSAQIAVEFPYFMDKAAPVTGATALMDYSCRFMATLDTTELDFILSVKIPVTSLCPCSKEISDYGAHNQRGHIDVSLRTLPGADGRGQLVWIEEVVELAESCASSPVFPLLKRPDERHVTMQAFENPAFVEDIARDVMLKMRQDDRIAWCKVEVVNQESIHNHNAFAAVEWSRSSDLEMSGS